MLVVGLEVQADGVLQGAYAVVGTRAHLALREEPKPALDLVDPRGVDRCEVQMEPGMAPQAPIDRGSFVSDAVVHHEMDIEVGWDFGVNALQESEKLTGAMAPVEVPDHLAAADGQGCEQGGGSVTTVVMGLAPQRLGTVQRLNL